MRLAFVKTVIVDSNAPVASSLSGYLRGQWVFVNGMMARIVNHTGSRVVLWIPKEKDFAVFA